MRRDLISLVGIIALAGAGIIYTVFAGNEPLLGLDLKGGASVVLEPEPREDGQPITDDSLDQAVEIIRNRVDGLGVREPEITRQGQTILVQIPGVTDQQRAIDLVGQTAELRFRPVLKTASQADELAYLTALAAVEDESTSAADRADAEAVIEEWTLTPDALASEPAVLQRRGEDAFTSRMKLGPVPEVLSSEIPGQRLTGEVLESAAARYALPDWVVQPVFRAGSPGIDDFNVLAAQCNTFAPSCPEGRIAIEIDGLVESDPVVEVPYFERDRVNISGSEDESAAKDLALALNFGALPVELTPQESRIVSATLGSDALRAGVIAGLVGLALVSLYLVAYYRLLGLVAIASLAISGAVLWTIISWLGESQGLALTLAGVTGLIVSIGVSVDSNVVYFENLKEEFRAGRPFRSSVTRAFPAAFSTIVKADVASLIAAVVLYLLTVGQVRGFALFLGLATVLDLVATYFFMGPAVRLLVHRLGGLGDHPTRLGMPKPEVAS